MSHNTNKPTGTGTEPKSVARNEPVQNKENKARLIDKLYREFWDDLCGWLRRYYGAGPPEPEDIAQATFEKLSALNNLDKIQNPRAFIYTIASRTAVSEVRSLIRARKYIDTQLNNLGVEMEDITPERVYIARERFDAVVEAMQNLSRQEQEIVLRCKVQGQTYDQISAETGWSPATISRHLKSALLTLYNAQRADKQNPNDTDGDTND